MSHLSRYIPDNTAYDRYSLNSRDHQIIECVYTHRFLDTELLWHLLKPAPQPSLEKREGRDGKLHPTRQGFGLQAVYRRLQRLYHLGYLVRHFASDQAIGRGLGSPRAIYGIGTKSVPMLAKLVRIPPYHIRQLIDADRVKSPFLRHTLEVARFRVILELACRKQLADVRLSFWDQGIHLRTWVTGKNEIGEDERFCAYPDAFFALETRQMLKSHYFLELDRGTEPIIASSSRSDIRRKLFGYRYLRKRGAFRSPYAPDFRGFTVLFLVATGQSTSDRHQSRVANIMHVMPMFGPSFRSTSLFWFSEMHRFSLEQADSVFSPVWQSNRLSGNTHSLSIH